MPPSYNTPHEGSIAGERPNMLEAALAYAKQGVSVFPLHGLDQNDACDCGNPKCSNPGKHPWTTHGFVDASTKEFVIRQWWRKWPNANIGGATGGWAVVLDADDDDGLKEAEAYGADLTGPHHLSGQGRHLLFAPPDGIVLRCKRKLVGTWPLAHCDARAEGGYVVLPPSRHFSGKRYQCPEPYDVTALPAVPEKLLAVWRDAPSDPRNRERHDARDGDETIDPDDTEANGNDALGAVSAEHWVGHYTRKVLRNPTVGRHDMGVNLALYLHDWVSWEAAQAYMRRYQQAVADARPNKDYYTWDDARKALEWAFGQAAREAEPAGITPGHVVWAMQRYREEVGKKLRYLATFDRYYVSNGKWWEPNEDRIEVKWAHDVVRKLYIEAARETDPARRTRKQKLAARMDTSHALAAMVQHASAEPPLVVHVEDCDPNDGVAVAGTGVIDLRTGLLLPHRPDVLHTRHVGLAPESIAYELDARCPQWLAFLAEVQEERNDVIAFLQRAVGYTLTGDVSEQVWFLLYGDGFNGKSVFLRVLRELLGTYGRSSPISVFLEKHSDAHPTELARLAGARGALTAEPPRGRRLDEELIKAVTGGEDIDARFMRQDFFTFRPKFKIWMSANDKPVIRGQNKGIWRRTLPVPFTYTIPDKQRNKWFFEQVLLPELPGILRWAVEGSVAWQKEGLWLPKRVQEAKSSYQDESNAILRFLIERTEADPAAVAGSRELYDHYAAWCDKRHERLESQTAFSLEVKRKYGVESQRLSVGGRQVHGFRGVAYVGDLSQYDA